MPTIPLIPSDAALQSCWQQRSSFTLLDLDFDGGRRLLATAAAMLRDPDAPDRLHYVAVIDPLPDVDAAAVARVAAAMAAGEASASFAAFAAQLCRAWPPAPPIVQAIA